MALSTNLAELITQQAQAQGVPPDVALAVAQQESGITQWRQDGSVVTSAKGALGVFQLMPATAAQLGVDPTDVYGNIQGGISYLSQLYQKYGDWNTALAAYNFGPGNVDAGKSLPSETVNYVSSILGKIGTGPASGVAVLPGITAGDLANEVTANPGVIAVGVVLGVVLFAWWAWAN